jgi:hypothetical protein
LLFYFPGPEYYHALIRAILPLTPQQDVFNEEKVSEKREKNRLFTFLH